MYNVHIPPVKFCLERQLLYSQASLTSLWYI